MKKHILLLSIVLISIAVCGQPYVIARGDIAAKQIVFSVPDAPANVQLTDDEKIQLRGSSGAFRSYLIQKIINEMGSQLGASSYTQQTARWFVFAKTYISSPGIVTQDANLVEFAVARMITAGLAQKNNAAAGDLEAQVISFLEANAPSNIPQAYLDEKTKVWQ